MTLRFRDWPWALKLGLLLVAAAILPLSASTLYSDVMMRREQVANASLRDLQRARNTAVLLDEYLRDLVGDTIIVALAPPTVSVLQDPDSARPCHRAAGTVEQCQGHQTTARALRAGQHGHHRRLDRFGIDGTQPDFSTVLPGRRLPGKCARTIRATCLTTIGSTCTSRRRCVMLASGSSAS